MTDTLPHSDAVPRDITDFQEACVWARNDAQAISSREKVIVDGKYLWRNPETKQVEEIHVVTTPKYTDYPNLVKEKAEAPNQVTDPQAYAREKARQSAEQKGATVTVEVKDSEGKVVAKATESPTPRQTDINEKAEGTPSPTPPPPNARTAASAAEASTNITGSTKQGDEQDNSPSPGVAKDQLVKVFNGAPRVMGGVVPSLEAVMMGIPAASLGKFTSLLPPAFKSLLPLGAVAGLVSKGPVSLGGLTNLVAGAALGAVAGQALRSLTGGPRAVSGLSGALGAQAIARVSGNTAIPVNIASTFGNALLSRAAGNVAGNIARNAIGTDPSTSAVIANVVGVVTNVALNKNSGIPVSSQVLGLAANVALRSAGVPTAIPTSILGLAASSAANPLASLIGSSVSGRIPILPGNLSLPNIGAMSGLSQNIGPGLAETLIPPNQIVNLLPGNLQAQIPMVPPRITGGSPYISNNIGARREAAQESSGPVVPNDKQPPPKDAVAKGAGGGDPKYDMKVSDNYTLADFTIKPVVAPNRYLRPYTPGGLSVDQLIENISWMAVNIIEPIRSQFPGFRITSSYDFPGAVPGSKRAGGSRHFFGCASDLQWSDARNFAINKERAEWIAKNLPIRACILEAAGGAGIWIHVDGRKQPEAKYIATHKYWSEISRGYYVNPL